MNSQINVKIEPELKKQADIVSYNLGLNTSDVIRVFLKKFVSTNGFPFPLINDYNEDTIKAMKDAAMKKNVSEIADGINGLKKALE